MQKDTQNTISLIFRGENSLLLNLAKELEKMKVRYSVHKLPASLDPKIVTDEEIIRLVGDLPQDGELTIMTDNTFYERIASLYEGKLVKNSYRFGILKVRNHEELKAKYMSIINQIRKAGKVPILLERMCDRFIGDDLNILTDDQFKMYFPGQEKEKLNNADYEVRVGPRKAATIKMFEEMGVKVIKEDMVEFEIVSFDDWGCPRGFLTGIDEAIVQLGEDPKSVVILKEHHAFGNKYDYEVKHDYCDLAICPCCLYKSNTLNKNEYLSEDSFFYTEDDIKHVIYMTLRYLNE